jgi:hypothetical protein
MAPMMRALRTGLAIALCFSVISCGGGGNLASSGGGTPPPSGTNVVTVTVDDGPTVNGSAVGSVNTLFTSITVCVPGTTTCQTIDHVQVDTGSYGVRILAAALSSQLALPLQTDSAGNSLAECVVFADGYSWGPVALADVKIGGETASSTPTQIIGASPYPSAPSDCVSQTTMGEEDTVTAFGANGIIGIGPFSQDCPECSTQAIPGAYYYCSSTTCTDTVAALNTQAVNPVTKFPVDNNGVIITLPSVANAGEVTMSGTLTFGVDTETNNVSGAQTVLNVDDFAELSMTFGGIALTSSFIDSGSNGIYFNTNSLPTCAQTNIDTFYCPPNTVANLGLTLQGLDSQGNPISGQSTGTSFSVGSAQVLFNSNNSVIPLLAGTFPGSQTTFDYGLPFFYGRRVAVVVDGATTTVGTGPYVAF